MGIVLLEPPDSCKTAQRAAGLVAVKHAKVGKTKGQLLVTPFLNSWVRILHKRNQVRFLPCGGTSWHGLTVG
jgi:hypothetical protein